MHIAPTVLGVTKRSECVVSSATKEEAKEAKEGQNKYNLLTSISRRSIVFQWTIGSIQLHDCLPRAQHDQYKGDNQ